MGRGRTIVGDARSAPPPNEVPALLRLPTLLLARSENAAVFFSTVAVYRSGIAVGIEIRLRVPGPLTIELRQLVQELNPHSADDLTVVTFRGAAGVRITGARGTEKGASFQYWLTDLDLDTGLQVVVDGGELLPATTVVLDKASIRTAADEAMLLWP